MLYLEGSTNLSILQSFAKKLKHPAEKHLERPFVHYVDNLPNVAEKHFFGLQEAKKDLAAIAIYDRLDRELNSTNLFLQVCWKKKEIENYFVTKDVLLSYVVHGLMDDLFGSTEAENRKKTLLTSIDKIENAIKTLALPMPWSDDIKITTDFLDRVFKDYFEQLKQPNILRKSEYNILIDFFPAELIDREVTDKLDKIVEIAQKAKPESEF